MSHEIRPDYQTQYLFPPSLEDWVGPDDPARFIREFVRQLDLSSLEGDAQAVRNDDSNGRPHYALDLLLSVWLYGYYNGITSARKLERACRKELPLIWLAGRYEPDHNTLWRFWARYGKRLRELFLRSVAVAARAGLVGMALHAVDGTKIISRASERSEWHRADLEKMLGRAAERIESLERQIAEAADSGEPDERLPEALREHKALEEKIRRTLAELDEEEQDHLQPNDREARMMMLPQRRVAFAYNAQVVTDEKTQIIVAAHVTNEASDSHQLLPMLEEVENNLGHCAKTTVADSGYYTAQALGTSESMGVAVLVVPKQNPSKAGPYHTSRFRYDEELDAVECPQGQRLERSGTHRHRHKPHALKTYRCKVTDCPVRSQCSKDPAGRLIEINPYHAAVERHRQKLSDPDQQALLRRRRNIERVFAGIKEHLKFRRWTMAGLEKVEQQWLMLCTVMNLRKLIAVGG